MLWLLSVFTFRYGIPLVATGFGKTAEVICDIIIICVKRGCHRANIQNYKNIQIVKIWWNYIYLMITMFCVHLLWIGHSCVTEFQVLCPCRKNPNSIFHIAFIRMICVLAAEVLKFVRFLSITWWSRMHKIPQWLDWFFSTMGMILWLQVWLLPSLVLNGSI